MKYILRLLVYCVIFFVSFSVSYTLCLRLTPVTITPLKIVKLFENAPQTPFRLQSEWVWLSNINQSMPKAVIASEDNFFLVHPGFDWKAIKLARKEYAAGKRRRGASTISQQTAKNVFCFPSQGWVRKGFETYYTALIEALWSKRRIMEVYLNIIETGSNVYGVQSAARLYFRKQARELNNYDSAMIAAVLPNPMRLKLAAPSQYLVRRSATIRSMMSKLPAVDFDKREEYEKMFEKYRSSK